MTHNQVTQEKTATFTARYQLALGDTIMSIEARREYLTSIRKRYRNSRRWEKQRILDEFCEVCGYSRKYAIRILNGRVEPRSQKPGRKAEYGQEFVAELKALWRLMNRMCSKNMRAALPLWLPYYDDEACTPEIREQLLRVSPATIDRLLRPYRGDSGLRGLTTTRRSWIKNKIPIELLQGAVLEPGFIEADTVGHCGTSTHGEYVCSLTMTDLYSGWTENRACLGKGQDAVLSQIRSIERTLPFALRGFACDNGTEFLNEEVYRYLKQREKRPIHFVRRRPYKKNDAAHVEQKNYTHVRQLFGYERLQDPELVKLMNEIYLAYWNPLLNYFTPSLKLLEKTRVGAKIKKKYEAPLTPAQRLIDSPVVGTGIKGRLIEHRSHLNPISLKRELDKKLKIFFQLVEITKRRVA